MYVPFTAGERGDVRVVRGGGLQALVIPLRAAAPAPDPPGGDQEPSLRDDGASRDEDRGAEAQAGEQRTEEVFWHQSKLESTIRNQIELVELNLKSVFYIIYEPSGEM